MSANGSPLLSILQKHSSWLVPMMIAASAMVGAYFHDDKALSERVRAVEVRQDNDASSLNRVETKVDKIYDKLLTWEK